MCKGKTGECFVVSGGVIWKSFFLGLSQSFLLTITCKLCVAANHTQGKISRWRIWSRWPAGCYSEGPSHKLAPSHRTLASNVCGHKFQTKCRNYGARNVARVCRVCMHCRGRKDLCSHGTPVWLSSLPPLRSYLPATGMAMTRMAVQCRIQIPFIPEKKARDFPLAVSRAKGSVLAHPQNLPRATRMHFAVHRSTDKLLLQMQELARLSG